MSAEVTKEYIKKWDPLGLINDLEVPDDEYNREAYELFWWFLKNKGSNEEQVADHLYSLLVDMSGDSSAELDDQCKSRGADLLATLLEDVKNDETKRP